MMMKIWANLFRNYNIIAPDLFVIRYPVQSDIFKHFLVVRQ